MILHEVMSEILEISYFEVAIFEKWPKLIVSPSFFSGNIANMIPEGPLNKMVPLTEDHGWGVGVRGVGVGGVHGDPR